MAARAPEPAEIRVCEVMGVTVEVADSALNDMEVVDLIDDIDEGKAQKFPKLLKRILGDGQYRRVAEELSEGGRFTVERAGEFFTGFLEEFQAKN